jgi:hypothetical protein
MWERKILRIIFGPTYGSGYWRINMNQEMFDEFKSLYIVAVITVRVWSALGIV